MKSDLTKTQAETRKIEEEKVEALHSFTNSINQSVKMLDREKQKLEAENDNSGIFPGSTIIIYIIGLRIKS